MNKKAENAGADVASEENRDANVATARQMIAGGQATNEVVVWLSRQCPKSIGDTETAAKAISG